MRNTILLFLVHLFIFSALASAQEAAAAAAEAEAEAAAAAAEAEADLYTQWEETLAFGIEGDVISAITAMIDEKDDVLSELVLKLFSSSRNEIRLKVIEYFEEFESDALIPLVLGELEFYQDLPSVEFTARLFEHLSQRKHNIDDKLWSLLEEMLQEEGAAVKSAIVSYIGTVEYQPAAAVLAELYEESAEALQTSILRTLGQIQDGGTESLIFDLAADESSDRSIRLAAIDAAAAYANAAALALISELVASSDPLLKTAAVSTLANFSHPDVQELYLEALRDSLWRVRMAALRGIEAGMAVSHLAGTLPALKYMARNDPEAVIRQQALKSIAALENNDGWGYLREILGDKDLADAYRQNAALLLIRGNFAASHANIEEVMVEKWNEKDSRLLDTICKELSTQDLPAAAMLYEKMLGHNNFIIQIYGVRGVGRNQILALKPQLEAFAEEESSNTVLRNNARAALKLF